MRSSEPAILFGKNANQIEHTFRHIDRLGLDREIVVTAISEDLNQRQQMSPGSYIAGKVSVSGVILEYRAFGLDDGTVNIGRITGV